MLDEMYLRGDALNLVGLIMRAGGLAEVRITDETLLSLGTRQDYVLVQYRDHMRDQTVIKLRPMLEVLDGEEVLHLVVPRRPTMFRGDRVFPDGDTAVPWKWLGPIADGETFTYGHTVTL